MIEIRNFLRREDGTFEPLLATSDPPEDPLYVEGAIELVIDGVEIMGLTHWDLVDQLWAYICTLLARLPAEQRVSTLFPDMPVEFAIERIGGGRVLVSCSGGREVRRTSVGEAELVEALSAGARHALGLLSALLPENAEDYRHDLSQLPPAKST
ncbi:hypothetical protein ABZ215_23530 [Amycolatopsis sp. NPDC006131]|uniref:hypothetical protein n=1 Tax=Amycolatopsis sp. NPDC006131 TaxID=3156731 RepID=UPI0033ABD143